jgi:hypothetical protein
MTGSQLSRSEKRRHETLTLEDEKPREPHSSFAILKRGLYGTFHNVSEFHLQRYANEFDFRWNHRIALGIDDIQRTNAALKGISGKRLTYRRIGAQV